MLLRIKQTRMRIVNGEKRYGTDVEMGHRSKGTYRVHHFRPLDPRRPEEDHVCNVENAEDIGMLLAIKEGYEVHPSEVKSRVAATAGAVGAAGNPTTGLKDTSTTVATVASGPQHYASMKKPDLIKILAERTGKAPHFTAKRETLIATLEELDKAAK